VTIIILERVPASLRGELTRWLLEPRAGVFVGRISALIREKLWELVCQRMKSGAGMLIHTNDSEQGYAVRLWGRTPRVPTENEGLTLFTFLSEAQAIGPRNLPEALATTEQGGDPR